MTGSLTHCRYMHLRKQCITIIQPECFGAGCLSVTSFIKCFVMLKTCYRVSPRLPQSESRDVELLDVGLWWWSALNLRLKNPFKVFSTSNWNLGGSSDGRQPPCLKMAAATFHFWKFWHFSHRIFGLILILSKPLSENGCNNISDIFHIGTLCIAVNALAWFWCSQKLCKSLWSKLIGFCKMGIFQYFRPPGCDLWSAISSIASAR